MSNYFDRRYTDAHHDHEREPHSPATVAIALLHECFECDAELGILTWRVRPLAHFTHSRQCAASNARYAGQLAGAISPSGYLDVTVCGQKMRVHRVIWAMHTGAWPAHEIDHANLAKLDNRFSNLREATRSQNTANQPVSPRNKVGLKGVCAHNSRYRAQIKAGGRVRYLGMFDTPELAHAAYCEAAREHHGEFAGGLCS